MVEAGGRAFKIAVVDGWLLAQCTLRGTILINKCLLEDDRDILECAVLHEAAHRKSVFRLVFYAFPPLTVAVLALLGHYLLVLPLTLLSAVLASWLAELHAENECAKALGPEKFMEVREKLMEKYSAQPLLLRFYHPPNKLTQTILLRLRKNTKAQRKA